MPLGKRLEAVLELPGLPSSNPWAGGRKLLWPRLVCDIAIPPHIPPWGCFVPGPTRHPPPAPRAAAPRPHSPAAGERVPSLATRCYRRRPSFVVSVFAPDVGLMRTACASSFSKSVLTK